MCRTGRQGADPPLRLTFLGTGTSFGVPLVGCDCAVCTSSDPRDKRTRTSALLELPGGTLLVDTSPELRLQLLAVGARRVDAVWFTHLHADHVHGIDDLRVFSDRRGRPLPCYVPEADGPALFERFSYIFDDAVQAPDGTSKPQLEMRPVPGDAPLDVLGSRIHPVPVPHGDTEVYGFRVGRLGYVTDANDLPESALTRLRGVDVLVLNALWFGKRHPTHFTVEEAVAAAARVGAARTFLVHLTHKVGHRELLERLPAEVRPAHDGLTVEV